MFTEFRILKLSFNRALMTLRLKFENSSNHSVDFTAHIEGLFMPPSVGVPCSPRTRDSLLLSFIEARPLRLWGDPSSRETHSY